MSLLWSLVTLGSLRCRVWFAGDKKPVWFRLGFAGCFTQRCVWGLRIALFSGAGWLAAPSSHTGSASVVFSAAVLKEEPGDLCCSEASTPDMFACCLSAVYLSVNFGQTSLCGMLGTDGFCFYLLGTRGKMLTELCFQEPASSLLTHAAPRSVRVGTP